MAKLKLTTTEKALVITVLALVIFAVGTQLTIINNPVEVQYLDAWYKGSYTTPFTNPGSANYIANIYTATISGTVTAFRDFKPVSYIKDGITYSFSRLYLSVYAKQSDGTYSTTVTKEYSTTTQGGPGYAGWYESVLPVDTTLIPNGDYKFVLTLAFEDSGGEEDPNGYFSVFYVSFSTGSTNGNNGGGDAEPAPPDNTMIYVVGALIGFVVVYEMFLKKKR